MVEKDLKKTAMKRYIVIFLFFVEFYYAYQVFVVIYRSVGHYIEIKEKIIDRLTKPFLPSMYVRERI